MACHGTIAQTQEASHVRSSSRTWITMILRESVRLEEKFTGKEYSVGAFNSKVAERWDDVAEK
jgi:hypothetical protein